MVENIPVILAECGEMGGIQHVACTEDFFPFSLYPAALKSRLSPREGGRTFSGSGAASGMSLEDTPFSPKECVIFDIKCVTFKMHMLISGLGVLFLLLCFPHIVGSD